MGKTLACSILVVLAAVAAEAGIKKPPRDILGVRLGVTEDAARKRLRKIGNQQKEEKGREEEGEQEVWTLKADSRFDYLLVRFDHEHRLFFMTIVVRAGARMRYADVADLKLAQRATDGRNYSYTWRVEAKGKQPPYAVVARGSDPELLTSYSIFRLAR